MTEEGDLHRPALLSLGFFCGACSAVGADVFVEVQLGLNCSRSRACSKHGSEKSVHVVSPGDSGRSVLVSDEYFFAGQISRVFVQNADH
jgi:hypothetical protein